MTRSGVTLSTRVYNEKEGEKVVFPATAEQLRKMHWDKGMTLGAIATELGCHEWTVSKYMKKYGVERRDSRFGLHDNSKYDFNLSFFSEPTPELAWVVGILLTDGYISNRRILGLELTDRDVVEKVRAAIGSTHPITEKRSIVHKTRYVLRVGSTELTAILAGYGVVPAKSKIVRLPLLSQELLPHIIRGIWDGDGHLGLRGGSMTADLVSASRYFIEQDVAAVLASWGIKNSIYTARGYGQWHIQTILSAHNLCEIMYRDSAEHMRMDRKYQTYLKHLAHCRCRNRRN
jgi:hypothetical protein